MNNINFCLYSVSLCFAPFISFVVVVAIEEKKKKNAFSLLHYDYLLNSSTIQLKYLFIKIENIIRMLRSIEEKEL